MYLAVDIGGTKTLLGVFDSEDQLIDQKKFETDSDYRKFCQSLAANISNLTTKDFKRAVVAVPGKVDRKHGVGLAFGNLGWENVSIQDDLEKLFNCPVLIENDGNLAGLSEARLLENRYRKVLYVTISTGIGGGYIIDGIINQDLADAEIGHMLLEHHSKLQRWEDFASGKAIVKEFGKRASEIESNSDWYIIARNIAIGLIDLIATLTPDIIIIGGGVGTHLDKFKDRLDEELKIYQNPLLNVPPIVKAKRAEEAVIWGCLILAKEGRKWKT